MSMTVEEAIKYWIEWEIVLNLLNLKLARATGIIRAMLFISTLFISSDLDKGGGGGGGGKEEHVFWDRFQDR